MSIKQLIIIAFTLIVAAMLALFSLYVYYSYEDYRKNLIYERLFARAEASKQILKNQDTFRKDIFFPLNEQYEAVYNEQNELIVSTDETNDYIPDDAFLKKIRLLKRYQFSYSNPQFEFNKEGVALVYLQNGKPFVSIVTAYDLNGHNMSRTLRFSLFFGNILALFVIAITAYFFSNRALQPFDLIIKQIDKADIDDFGFRIHHNQEVNEATTLAKSFNELLEKIQYLGENQKHFISYASHELRTPLTVVKGILQTSLAYDRTSNEWKNSTKEAIIEVNRTIELANNLLLLAEVEAFRSEVEFRNIDLIDLIMDSIAYINQKYPEQKLDFDLGEQLSNENIQATVSGISHLLRSSFINIIDNACKYSNFSPVVIQVEKVSEMIIIKIIDNGIGILSQDLGTIFLPMMRGNNTTGIQGFGVGLTLVHKIILLHKGKIELFSELNQGTIVQISLLLVTF